MVIYFLFYWSFFSVIYHFHPPHFSTLFSTFFTSSLFHLIFKNILFFSSFLFASVECVLSRSVGSVLQGRRHPKGAEVPLLCFSKQRSERREGTGHTRRSGRDLGCSWTPPHGGSGRIPTGGEHCRVRAPWANRICCPSCTQVGAHPLPLLTTQAIWPSSRRRASRQQWRVPTKRAAWICPSLRSVSSCWMRRSAHDRMNLQAAPSTSDPSNKREREREKRSIIFFSLFLLISLRCANLPVTVLQPVLSSGVLDKQIRNDAPLPDHVTAHEEAMEMQSIQASGANAFSFLCYTLIFMC